MKRALILGASGGIGAAFHDTLTAKGVEVVGLSRRRDGLDFAVPAQTEEVLARVEGPFDIVLVATGALTCTIEQPEKSLAVLTAEEMAAQFAVNAIGPALALKHAKRWLPRKERSVFAVLSARVGSIGDNGLGGWYSYRTAKAALNQVVKTAAIEIARSHKQAVCVALHPGTVATEFTADFNAPHKLTPHDSATRLLAVLDGLSPEDTGSFLDWKGARVPW